MTGGQHRKPGAQRAAGERSRGKPGAQRAAGERSRGKPGAQRAAGERSRGWLAARDRAAWAAVVAVRESFRWLPPSAAIGLGAGIGRLYCAVGGPRTSDAAAHLALAFPEWSDADRRRVRAQCFANLGRTIAEVSLLQGPRREALLAGVRWEGWEHLEKARAESKTGGLILVGAHFGNWELLAMSVVRRGAPFSTVYHDVANPYLHRMLIALRERGSVVGYPFGQAARRILADLKQGRVVGMLVDQNAHREDGVFAPFFAHPACTRSAPMRIAMRTGAPVLPIFLHRTEGSACFTAKLGRPLALRASEEDPQGALEHNVAVMNQALEEAIRSAPDHWIWTHRRWKTQPSLA